MQQIFLILCILALCRFDIYGQCQTDIDFNTWSREGHAANGVWTVQNGGTSVLQSINGDPTFYVSPDTFINVQISGKIRVNDSFDDDFVGFVFGYRAPDISPNLYDLWLFDWKREEQTKGNPTIYLAQEGFTLSRIQGSISSGDNNYWPNFWGHDSSNTCNPIATDYGFSKGWSPFTDYNFTLLYTPTRATILINNDTIFDEVGCYEPGRFGFYNYSQSDVEYSDFSYRLISNFEVENNDYDPCINEPVNFLFTDSTCSGGTSAASNIASWNWDFGNGITSTQPNPSYTFNTAGSYDIQLLVTDVNGCQDSVSKSVVVHPPPMPMLATATITCPSDSVGLDASGGVSYLWEPSIGLSDPTIANPMAFPPTSTTYTLTMIDQFGCEGDTTVDFHWFAATVDPTTVICEGESTTLGAGGGSQYLWTPSSSLNDPSLPNPVASPSTTTTYQAIVTDTLGCADTVFQTVHINPKPILSISPDTSVCANIPVTFTVSGAASYTWLDSAGNFLGTGTSQTLSFPTSTWIYVQGIDGNACQNIDSIQLTIIPPPTVDAGPDLAICSYDSITIGASNNPSGTYVWNPGMQLDDPTLLMPVFSPPSAGLFDFTLTVTDLNGCVSTDEMSIQVFPFEMAETHSDVLCFGENSGSSTLMISGTSPFSFDWLDGAGNSVYQTTSTSNTATADSLFTGTYTAIAVDSFGCTDSIVVDIQEPLAPLTVNLDSLMNVDCLGNINGEIHVLASGGTPTYQYSIDGGFNFSSSGMFTGLGPTIYTVLVQDSNLCEASLTDTIQTPTGLFAQITTLKHIDCFGANNGAFALVAQGGAAPYQYSLDNITFSSNLSVSNLSPGPDTVYFFDANDCQVTLPFEIFEPPVLTASITDNKGIDCFGQNNGQIWITTAGGSGAYHYSLDSLSFQADSSFANLSGGADTLIVQDDSLCSVSIPFMIEEPPALTLDMFSQQNVDCFGNATGAIELTTGGGVPGYQFSVDSLIYQSDSAFSNLSAGLYTFSVQDDSSCITELLVDITEPPQLSLSSALQVDVDCYGNDSGLIILQSEGGTLPHQFSVDGLNFQSDSLFQNLIAGVYTFWVEDDSNCVEQLAVEIREPDSLQLLIAEQLDVDCFGNDNGSVQLSVEGGTFPFLFSINGGTLQSDSLFSPLIPGIYSLHVQDDSLCVAERDIEILEPPLLQIEVSHTDVQCFGFDDGTGSVEIQGGTPVYSITWDSPIPQSTALATGLGPGSYEVVVSDQNGCTEVAGIDIWEPDTLELTIIESAYVEAYCNWANGAAAVEAVGGIEPYAFRWEGPVMRDGPAVSMLFGDTTYTAIVQDMNGCETAILVYVPQTPPATPIFSTEPSFEDSILLSQANVQFLNESVGAVAYSWTFGDGTLSDEKDPRHLFQDTGIYEVTLTAFNEYFVCPTDTTVLLHIIPDGALYIPTAFSPNDDNKNDFFYPMGEGLRQYQLDIFNRWGKPITVLTNLEARWDGRDVSGRAMPEGVYVYRVRAEMNNGTVINRGGTVTLLR